MIAWLIKHAKRHQRIEDRLEEGSKSFAKIDTKLDDQSTEIKGISRGVIRLCAKAGVENGLDEE